MLLLVLAQSPLVLTGPATQVPERVDLRQSGCRGPEAIVRTDFDNDLDADGVPESTDVIEHRYDARGNTVYTDYASDTINVRSEAEYDSSNRVIRSVDWLDFDGDDVFDIQTTTDTTYDTNGNPTTERRESTENGAVSVFLTSYTYNSSGFLTRVDSSDDIGNDGILEALNEQIYVLDAAGRVLRQTNTTDDMADGTIDTLSEVINTYDAQGNLTLSEQRFDADNDGVDNFRLTTSHTYDAQSRLISTLQELDLNGNGSTDAREARSFAYDASSRLIEELVEYDFDLGRRTRQQQHRAVDLRRGRQPSRPRRTTRRRRRWHSELHHQVDLDL